MQSRRALQMKFSVSEVLGKLALEMGIVNFANRFTLDNMTPPVTAIANRAISQRIAEGDTSSPGYGFS